MDSSLDNEESEEAEDQGKRREKSRGLKVTLDALEEIDPDEDKDANKEQAEKAQAQKEGREGIEKVETPRGCLTCANTEKEVACRADSKGVVVSWTTRIVMFCERGRLFCYR